MVYYNEFDPAAAAWLRELIRRGLIAPGFVDERSITEVDPEYVKLFKQAHFFAGIGGWSYALRLAGWPDDRPVWTGSPPCQPFSNAGKRKAQADTRHLWPVFFNLIRECRPPVIFGEQVEAAIRTGWLDDLQDDLEAEGYATGKIILPACGVGAPHIRQRIWFVAERVGDTSTAGLERHGRDGNRGDEPGWLNSEPGRSASETGGDGWLADTEYPERWPQREYREDGCNRADSGREEAHREPGACGEVCGMAESDSAGREQRQRHNQTARHGNTIAAEGNDGGVGNAEHARSSGAQMPKCTLETSDQCQARPDISGESQGTGNPVVPGGLRNWENPDWLYCRDGKWRPVEPGTFPLAHGIPARVVRLRGYGNAIVPQVAAEVIRAYMGVEYGI